MASGGLVTDLDTGGACPGWGQQAGDQGLEDWLRALFQEQSMLGTVHFWGVTEVQAQGQAHASGRPGARRGPAVQDYLPRCWGSQRPPHAEYPLCSVFAGPPDPLHGISLYQKVRAAAQVSPELVSPLGSSQAGPRAVYLGQEDCETPSWYAECPLC